MTTRPIAVDTLFDIGGHLACSRVVRSQDTSKISFILDVRELFEFFDQCDNLLLARLRKIVPAWIGSYIHLFWLALLYQFNERINVEVENRRDCHEPSQTAQ